MANQAAREAAAPLRYMPDWSFALRAELVYSPLQKNLEQFGVLFLVQALGKVEPNWKTGSGQTC